MKKKETDDAGMYLRYKDRGGRRRGCRKSRGQEVMSGRRGIPHSERDTWPSLEKMKGYFNWVSDACLILFSYKSPAVYIIKTNTPMGRNR